MNPAVTSLDLSPLATLGRQFLQTGAGALMGYAVARGWITADLAAQLVPLLVGLGVSLGTLGWAMAVKARTNVAAQAAAVAPDLAGLQAEVAALRAQLAGRGATA